MADLPKDQGAEAEERMAVMTQDLLTRLTIRREKAARLAPEPKRPEVTLVAMPPLRRRRHKTRPPNAA